MFRIAIALFTLTGIAFGDEFAKAKAAFNKADDQLNRLWGELKAELPEETFEKLKESQRDWLGHRDYVAEFNMTSRDNKPMADSGYLDCAAGLTEARVEFLKSWRDIGDPDSWAGLWADSYGGSFEFVERDGILYFRALCVRGPTAHIGDLSGIAKLNRRLARFSDKLSAPEKVREAGETWLSFIRRGGQEIEVVGANTGYYHGARAHFDGNYRRTALLNKEQQDEVVKAATAPIE